VYTVSDRRAESSRFPGWTGMTSICNFARETGSAKADKGGEDISLQGQLGLWVVTL
jgi:hypothetical protein